jgi:hypothetical protein
MILAKPLLMRRKVHFHHHVAKELHEWPSVRVLRGFHVAAALVHVTWVVCAALALPSVEVGVNVIFRRTLYLTNSTAVIGSEDRTDFNFKSLSVLLAFPAVTAAFHLAYASLPGAGGWGNPLRWLEYAISATLLTLSAAVASGVTDADAFAFAVALSVGLQACGLALDLLPREHPPAGLRPLLLCVGFLNVAALFWQIARHAFTNSSPHGAPESAKKVSLAFGVYYFSFGVVATLRAYGVGLWRSAAFTEYTYAVLSLSSKTAVFWLSFAGIKLMLNFLRPAEADHGLDWFAVQVAAAAAPAAVAAAALLVPLATLHAR